MQEKEKGELALLSGYSLPTVKDILNSQQCTIILIYLVWKKVRNLPKVSQPISKKEVKQVIFLESPHTWSILTTLTDRSMI